MDELKKYECPDCGTVKEVAVDAEVPTCEDCGVAMEPVVASVEEDDEDELVDELGDNDEELE